MGSIQYVSHSSEWTAAQRQSFSEHLGQFHQNARNYQTRLRRNEAATRYTLIDPILQALGWDLADPVMVEVEKFYRHTRVDYLLNAPNGDHKILIEAKALGKNLNYPSMLPQLTYYLPKYAYTTESLILTNGLVWESYTNFHPSQTGRIIDLECIDLECNTLDECAWFLIQKLAATQFWPKPTSNSQVSGEV